MQARSYDVLEPSSLSKDSPNPLTSYAPLTFDKPVELVYHPPPPKGVLRKMTHNPFIVVAQHYSIVEDLSQDPYAMSALVVL